MRFLAILQLRTGLWITRKAIERLERRGTLTIP